MTVFDDLMTDVGLPLLDDMFGEQVTLFPASGAAARTVTVRRLSRTQLVDDQAHHRLLPDTVVVVFRRHATTGLTSVGIGDAIRLAGADTDARWSYVQTTADDAATITAEFRRSQLQTSGNVRPSAL